MKLFTMTLILVSTISCSIYQSPGRECLIEGAKCSVIDDSVEIQSIFPAASCALKSEYQALEISEQQITSQSIVEHRGQAFTETVADDGSRVRVHTYAFIKDLNAHAYCNSEYDSQIEFEQNHFENSHFSLETLHSKLITKYRSID